MDSYVILWDAIKCFDKIPRDYIWKSMAKVGVDEHMIEAAKSTLKDTDCILTVEGVQRCFNMEQGSAQGTALGPCLCLYFFLPILKLWVEKVKHSTPSTYVLQDESETEVGTHINNFADDTMMIVESEDAAKKKVCMFAEFIETFQVKMHKGTKANPKSKSVVIHIPHEGVHMTTSPTTAYHSN